MTLSEIKDVAAILGVLIGVGSLVSAAFSLALALRTNRAKFWLDLRAAFAKHDDVHRKLRPGGEWQDNAGPDSAAEFAEVEAYMGMALTLVEARDPASVHVDEPVGEAFSTRGKVWVVAFAFVARYVRADDRPCIERLMRTAAGDHSCCKVLAPPTLSTVAPCA